MCECFSNKRLYRFLPSGFVDKIGASIEGLSLQFLNIDVLEEKGKNQKWEINTDTLHVCSRSLTLVILHFSLVDIYKYYFVLLRERFSPKLPSCKKKKREKKATVICQQAFKEFHLRSSPPLTLPDAFTVLHFTLLLFQRVSLSNHKI